MNRRLEKINPETRREAMGNLRGEVNLVRANCLTKILYEIYLVVRNFKVTPTSFLPPCLSAESVMAGGGGCEEGGYNS